VGAGLAAAKWLYVCCGGVGTTVCVPQQLHSEPHLTQVFMLLSLCVASLHTTNLSFLPFFRIASIFGSLSLSLSITRLTVRWFKSSERVHEVRQPIGWRRFSWGLQNRSYKHLSLQLAQKNSQEYVLTTSHTECFTDLGKLNLLMVVWF